LRYLLLSPVVDSADDRQEAAQMTCKIEQQADGHHTTLRLIGHLQAAHLEALQAQLESNGPRTVLDLDQVTLVDVEVVRFLRDCEAAGIAVLHGPPYIREWIRREQDRPG
jgi:glutathione S-transferase